MTPTSQFPEWTVLRCQTRFDFRNQLLQLAGTISPDESYEIWQQVCSLGVVEQGAYFGKKPVEYGTPCPVIQHAESLDHVWALATALIQAAKEMKVAPGTGEVLAERQDGGVDIGFLIGVHACLSRLTMFRPTHVRAGSANF